MNLPPPVTRLLVAAATALVAAAPAAAAIRWTPRGERLALDGAVAMTLTGRHRAWARELRAARLHLRQVRSGELVPLEVMTDTGRDPAGNPVLVYYPTEYLRPFTVYVLESRGPSLDLSRVYRTARDESPRLAAGPPRFRREGRAGARFACADLGAALLVEVELQRAGGGGDEAEWADDYYPDWEGVGRYLLRAPAPGGAVDLAPLLGRRRRSFRARFRLVGRDAFRGRPSVWKMLPAK